MLFHFNDRVSAKGFAEALSSEVAIPIKTAADWNEEYPEGLYFVINRSPHKKAKHYAVVYQIGSINRKKDLILSEIRNLDWLSSKAAPPITILKALKPFKRMLLRSAYVHYTTIPK